MNSTINTFYAKQTMKTEFLIALLVARSAFVPGLQAEIAVKPGDKVAFLGDSITAQGYGNPGGYVQLIGAALAANGVKVELIGAGWSGHKSNQMLERRPRVPGLICQEPTPWM